MQTGKDPLDHEAIPKGKKKELTAKLLLCLLFIILMLLIVGVDTCMKDAKDTAEIIQQTQDDDMMVEIDGLKWKRVTFFDEYDRCWKIYTSSDVRLGKTHGQKTFATPCPKEK